MRMRRRSGPRSWYRPPLSRSGDSKECLEREAGGAFGIVALAPGKGTLEHERVDDRPGILERDLEGVLLAVRLGENVEIFPHCDFFDLALEDDDLVAALQVDDRKRVRGEIQSLAGPPCGRKEEDVISPEAPDGRRVGSPGFGGGGHPVVVGALEPLGRPAPLEQPRALVRGPDPVARVEAWPACLGRAHDESFSRRRSFTTLGSALPPVSFITWPTRNPSTPSLPALKVSTCPSFSANTLSMMGSSSDASEIAVSPRKSSAENPGSPLRSSASVNAARGMRSRSAISLPSSKPFTASGSMPVAASWFMTTLATARRSPETRS